MKPWIIALPLVCAFGALSSAAAYAQTHTSKPAKPAKRGDAAPAELTEPTPAPAAASAPPASPKVLRTEVIADDNWTVTCAQTDQPNAKPRCSAVLKITQNQNNVQRVVFTWLMGVQDGKPISVLSMPSGVLIGPGVQVKIGAGEARKFNYALCQPDHCEAIVPLDEDIVKELKAAPTSEISVEAVGGSTVKFTANMKGFDRALAEVTK